MATLSTNATPPIELSLGTNEQPSWLVSLLQPSVDLGAVHYAPAGEPAAGMGTLVFFGVLLLAGYGLIRLTRG